MGAGDDSLVNLVCFEPARGACLTERPSVRRPYVRWSMHRKEGEGGRGDQATSVRPPLGGAELVIDARGSTPFVRGVVG